MNLKLVTLSKEYKDHLFEMMDEWTNFNEKIIPSAIVKNDYKKFETYMNLIDDNSNRLEPSSTFFVLDKDVNKFIGAVNIRHYLNDQLLLHGGHIGLGVRPTMRNKGYGKEIIKLALNECKKLKIDRVLMTCDKSNVASRKSILSNHGVLEEEVLFLDKYIQRFWIDNK